jgi:site-specific recombinase XerD
LSRTWRASITAQHYEEVTVWIEHLIRERHLAASSVNIAVHALRFLYGTTLGRDTAPLLAAVPRMKRNVRRAEVYAGSEVEALLTAPTQPRDRAFLMTVYAGGIQRDPGVITRTASKLVWPSNLSVGFPHFSAAPLHDQ